MHEHVLATFLGDESEPLRLVEPLHRTPSHDADSLKNAGPSRPRESYRRNATATSGPSDRKSKGARGGKPVRQDSRTTRTSFVTIRGHPRRREHRHIAHPLQGIFAPRRERVRPRSTTRGLTRSRRITILLRPLYPPSKEVF